MRRCPWIHVGSDADSELVESECERERERERVRERVKESGRERER